MAPTPSILAGHRSAHVPVPIRLRTGEETRELAELPGRISALEDEQKEIALRLADPALYQTDPQAANALSALLAEIDDELMALLERWEALEN